MPFPQGTTAGPYEIVQPLERGRGIVYKALDTRLKRFVAIKVLRDWSLARSWLRREMERSSA